MASPTGKKHLWTRAEEDLIREGRAQNPPRSWEDLGAEIGLHRQNIQDHARYHLGIRAVRPADMIEAEDDHRRECYPAGSSVTWGAIIKGSCLDGMPYPT
jgi:hypothetical protein